MKKLTKKQIFDLQLNYTWITKLCGDEWWNDWQKWRAVSYLNLSDDFIREFKDNLSWFELTRNHQFTLETVREFQDYIHWDTLSRMRISEDIIREFQDKLNWQFISTYQDLSENFIMEFKDKVQWDEIYVNQNCSKEFWQKTSEYWMPYFEHLKHRRKDELR